MNSITSQADSVEFDPFSQEFFDGAYDTYRRLRDEAPVYYSAKWDFWALSRYDDVAPATKDHETYSSAKGATLDMVKAHDDAIPVPKVIISMDPPEHQKMRKLVSNVFTPRAIASLESMVREKVYERIEALDPSSFDVVADFSALFPNDVITTMLGVPKEDRDQIRQWVDLLLERHPGEIAVPPTGFEASMNTGIYYYKLIQDRRAAPQDDMISRLIETEIERDGQVEKLTDVDIAGFATLLGGAGAETVTKLIGNAMVAFADFPDQWQKLRADRSKIAVAVEELLRYEAPSQYQVRTAMRDVTLHGITIPAGSAVLLMTGSATATSGCSPIPTGWRSIANARWASISHSVMAFTAVWVPPWREWRAVSQSRPCSISFPSTRSIATAYDGWQWRTSAGGPMCPSVR